MFKKSIFKILKNKYFFGGEVQIYFRNKLCYRHNIFIIIGVASYIINSKETNFVLEVILVQLRKQNTFILIDTGLLLWGYLCVCVCVSTYKLKCTYFLSLYISLSTLTQFINLNNMLSNIFYCFGQNINIGQNTQKILDLQNSRSSPSFYFCTF